MAVGGEPLRHIIPFKDHNKRGSGQRDQAHRNQRADIAGAHKRHHQECDKENQRRAEVIHQKQKPDAREGKQDIFCQAPGRLELIEGCSPHKDKRELHKF